MNRSVLAGAMCAAAALFAGCQDTVNTVENADKTMTPNTIRDARFVTDSFLSDRLALKSVTTSRTQDGFMRAQLEIVNVRTGVFAQAWSGMTTGEYKRHKGLTKENLRDNMTNVELALNTLAEVTATEISRQRNPKGMAQSRQTAKEGGEVARNARADIESRLGHSVISSERASDHLRPLEEGKTEELPSDDK